MRNYILAVVVVIIILTASFALLQMQPARAGREFVWNAYITVDKPPGDPWAGAAAEVVVTAGSLSRWSMVITVMSSPTTSSSTCPYPTTWSVFNALYLDPSIDIVRLVVFTGGWSFSSDRANVLIHAGYIIPGSECRYIVYQPTITYRAGIPYRWTIRFTYFNTSELKAMPIGILGTSNIVVTSPMSAECRRSDGTWSSSGLTLSTARTLVNSTHVFGQYTITFGTAWNATYVYGCRIFTTDSTVINDVNAATVDRDITTGRLYFVYHIPSTPIQVLVNDRFVYNVWVVLTSETVQV